MNKIVEHLPSQSEYLGLKSNKAELLSLRDFVSDSRDLDIKLKAYDSLLDKGARATIDLYKFADFFAEKDPTYISRLACGLPEVSKDGDVYKAKFAVLSVLADDKNGKTGRCSTPQTSVVLQFDEYGGLSGPQTLTMPSLFGYQRVYELENGKFVEKDKEKREKLIQDQKAALEVMVNVDPAHGYSNILPDTAKVLDVDIDGNYTITCDFIPSMFSGKNIGTVKKQSFKVNFVKKSDATDATVLSNYDLQIVGGNNYITMESAKTPGKGLFSSDKFGYFTIDSGFATDKGFKLVIGEDEGPEEAVPTYSIVGLPEKVVPYYEQIFSDEKKRKSTLSVLGLKSDADKKYYSMPSLSLTARGTKLEDPKKISVFPFEENISSLSVSPFMEKLRIDNKALFSGLKDPNGFYKLLDPQIDSFIQSFNKPIGEKVYPIRNPKTKEIQYYTAELKDGKITFTLDTKIAEYIKKQQEAITTRLTAIKAIYEDEKKAQDTLFATPFEQYKPGVHNLGLYDKTDVIHNIRSLNQKENILSVGYDQKKVSYKVDVWYSPTENAYLTSKDQEDPSPYEKKGSLYFDYQGKYDTIKNTKMYEKVDNKVEIKDVRGRFLPNPSHSGQIWFTQEEKTQ